MGKKSRKAKDKSATELKEGADRLSDEGRLDEAIEEYKASILLDALDPCSHFGLADAFFKKGRNEEAMGEVRESMRLRPGWPYYHNGLGTMLEACGRPEDAESEYMEALRLKPDLEDARMRLDRLLKIKR